MPARVAALAVAPVKGLRLSRVDHLEIARSGPVGDRGFVVVDERCEVVQTRRAPQLLQVAARVAASGALELSFPDGSAVEAVPEPGRRASTRLYGNRLVQGRLVTGELSDSLSEHLGQRVMLLALDEGQTGADDHPVTLMSSASLRAVGTALGQDELDPRRFRMTIEIGGVAAWEEHGWAGSVLQIGDVRLRVVDPVPRCVVVTRSPVDGSTDAPVLRALADLHGKRGVVFGVWCTVERGGFIHVGEPVIYK
jgi:uncharacterized protein YcbX